MATTSTLTDACSISLGRTPSGRPRVSSGGGPLRVVTLSADQHGARVALVPTRALLLAGDAVEVRVRVADGLRLHVQETSGTVAYDMRGGSATWSVDAEVGAGGCLVLDSLPWVSAHGSRVVRSLSVDLGAGATLLARETLVLGRSGEAPGSLVSGTVVTRELRPVLVEELRSEHLAPHRVLDSVLAVGSGVGVGMGVAGAAAGIEVAGAGAGAAGAPGSPAPLVLETGDRIWRRLGHEAHETAAALDPVWAAVARPQRHRGTSSRP